MNDWSNALYNEIIGFYLEFIDDLVSFIKFKKRENILGFFSSFNKYIILFLEITGDFID